jgi:hypothetical protein
MALFRADFPKSNLDAIALAHAMRPDDRRPAGASLPGLSKKKSDSPSLFKKSVIQ